MQRGPEPGDADRRWMLQAVGGSMLNPVAMSIITNTFTIPRERAQAIGVWAAVVGVSMALGPVVGGVLVSSVGWRSIFWINIPVVTTAVVLALRATSRSPRRRWPGRSMSPGRSWSSDPVLADLRDHRRDR